MKRYTRAMEEAIRIEAYILSERAGHPSGMEEAFWVQAEAAVRARPGSAGKRPSRKVAVKKRAPKKAAPATKAKPAPKAAIAPAAIAPAAIAPAAVVPAVEAKRAKPKLPKTRKA